MNSILLIAIIAILGPIIGSLIGVLKKPSETIMYNLLAFAAGVMLTISFLNLLPTAISQSSPIIAIIGFLIGCGIIFTVDKMIPHIHPELCSQEQGKKLEKTAYFLLAGIFIHNIPEGMAIGISGIASFKLSLSVALAIAIQKIPEGICTSVPYFYVTKKRLKSFLISASTAIPMLIGYFIASYFFQGFPNWMLGLITAATAGFMVYIASDELIPSSCCQLTNHSTIFSLILGVIIVIGLQIL